MPLINLRSYAQILCFFYEDHEILYKFGAPPLSHYFQFLNDLEVFHTSVDLETKQCTELFHTNMAGLNYTLVVLILVVVVWGQLPTQESKKDIFPFQQNLNFCKTFFIFKNCSNLPKIVKLEFTNNFGLQKYGKSLTLHRIMLLPYYNRVVWTFFKDRDAGGQICSPPSSHFEFWASFS